jgi:hypothetical protein
MQLPVQGHNQFDRPTDADFSRLNVFPELFNIRATFITDFPKSGSNNLTEWTAIMALSKTPSDRRFD